MNKSDLLNWLQEENQHWKALLAHIGPERMDQGGVAGHWSIKDIVAHLTPDHHRLVANIQAAQRGEPEPDRKSTRLNSSHIQKSRMPSSA